MPFARAARTKSGVKRTPRLTPIASCAAFDSTPGTADSVAARFQGEEAGMVYSRFQNPTVAMLEERIASLEGADITTIEGLSGDRG